MARGKGFVNYLENPIVAFLFVVACLVFIGWLLPDFWIFGFTAIFTYLVSDILLSLIIKGGNGIAVIPTIDNKTKHKGHAYLAFFIGMIFATVFSGFFNNIILSTMKDSNQWFYAVVIASFGLGIAVFADLQARFYAHNE